MRNMAASIESAPLLEEIDEEEEDEFDVIIRQAQAEEQAKIEIRSKKNNLYYDVPPLTSDKTHHLFVSHSNEPEEAEWTEQLINSLEIDYGLKCLWPKRDFKPGQQVGDQIQKGILGAEKVVLVLSPESNESNWCRYERDFAFHLSVNSEENRIIPVFFRQCDVPDLLKTLNYIDVTAGEDPSFRIRRSFDEDTRELRMLVPGMTQIKTTEQPINGNRVSITASPNLRFMWQGPSWSFRELEVSKRIELRKLGSKFAEKVYFEARNIVNNSTSLKFYSMTNSRNHILTFFFLLFCLIINIGMIIDELLQLLVKTEVDLALPLLVGVPFFFVIFGLVLWCFDSWNFQKLRRDIIVYSVKSVLDTKLLVNIVKYRCAGPILSILYYDVSQCLDRLVRTRKARNNIRATESEVRQDVISVLKNILTVNYDCLFLSNLPRSVVNRHAVLFNQKCLCEIADERAAGSEVV